MKSVFKPTIKDIHRSGQWSALEQALLDGCETGKVAALEYKNDLPADQSDADRRVRPALIRYLLLGGCKTKHDDCCRPHPRGVRLQGAWIDGRLDLHGCESNLTLSLRNCLFKNAIDLQDASLGALFLDGSKAEELVGLHRIRTRKNVHLRGGFEAKKCVNLGSADIGGGLALSLSTFASPNTFDAEGVSTRKPAVKLEGATIRGSLFLRGALVDGKVNLVRTNIGGNLQCGGLNLTGMIDLDHAKVDGAFVWEGVQKPVEEIRLRNAHFGVLTDDRESWDMVEKLRLGGFRYDRLSDPFTGPVRLKWLAKSINTPVERVERGHSLLHSDPQGFDPRPYTQLAKVLREDGLDAMAAQIMVEREDRQRRAEYNRVRARLRWGPNGNKHLLKAKLTFWTKGAFKHLFGYGHVPARVFLWILLIWFFGFCLYGTAYQFGQMAPNSDVILTSQGWLDAIATYEGCKPDCAMPQHVWSDDTANEDYETFHPILYALDLFVPLDALGQENAWAPSKTRGIWGWFGYYARMPIQMAGWIITAMGAAVVTGLVGRKD